MAKPDTIETIKKEPPPHFQLIADNPDDGGTGTAPLNFTTGLHDFEIEALPVAAKSDATDYTIFTDDPKTSAGAAGLLKSTQIGDFITYTLPVADAGTYDVKVGIKTNKGKGFFQLAIDGTNQGTPQDEYSSGMGYDVRDLGPVTFNTSGDTHRFNFSVTKNNQDSIGYQLVFDYIDLVPRLETETEVLTAQASAPLTAFDDAKLSGGQGTILHATMVGDFVTYTVPVTVPGTYDVKVGIKTNKSKGMFQLAIHGVNQGYAQDEYSPAMGYDVRDLGTVTFTSPGSKEFNFLVTGRNPNNSTGYELVFDDIDLVLFTHLEAEKLSIENFSAPLANISDRGLSDSHGTLLKATRVGDYISYIVPITEAGTYNVKVGIRTDSNSGAFQLAINNASQGSAQDEYSTAVGYQVRDLGKITFGPGNQEFKFSVTSKNQNSTGYQLSFDYIDLVR